jgi:hypothetical protein
MAFALHSTFSKRQQPPSPSTVGLLGRGAPVVGERDNTALHGKAGLRQVRYVASFICLPDPKQRLRR